MDWLNPQDHTKRGRRTGRSLRICLDLPRRLDSLISSHIPDRCSRQRLLSDLPLSWGSSCIEGGRGQSPVPFPSHLVPLHPLSSHSVYFVSHFFAAIPPEVLIPLFQSHVVRCYTALSSHLFSSHFSSLASVTSFPASSFVSRDPRCVSPVFSTVSY